MINFGKYAVAESLEYHFEKEPEWYWRILPCNSGHELVWARYYIDNTREIVGEDDKVYTIPPFKMDLMFLEVSLLFGGTNIPGDKGKPILKNDAKREEVEAVLKQMPLEMVIELWKAVGEVAPFWGPQPAPKPEEPEASEEEAQ